MYKAILFDLDDTLLRPEKSIIERLIQLDIDGVALFTEKNARQGHRKAELWTAKQILQEIQSGVRMDDMLFLENVISRYKMYANTKSDCIDDMIKSVITNRTKRRPQANIFHLLDKLKSIYILGVVSNNSTSIRTVLENFGLLPYFQIITISAEVGMEKPDPRILYGTCEKIGVSTECSVYVGDHPFDVLCTNSANMDCIWVDNGVYEMDDLPAHPKYIVSSVLELEKILLHS